MYVKKGGAKKNRDIIIKKTFFNVTNHSKKVDFILPFLLMVDIIHKVTSFHIQTDLPYFCILAVFFHNIDGGIAAISCLMQCFNSATVWCLY